MPLYSSNEEKQGSEIAVYISNWLLNSMLLGGQMGVRPSWWVACTESSHVGSVLGKMPVQFSRNKSHKYRGFGPILVPPTPSK